MKIASALLLALLAAPKPAVPVRKSAGFGIPRLAPSQLWVTSIPVGLEVRLGEDPKAKAVGRTPLVLKASEATRYVTVTLRKSEAAGKLPTQLDLADFTSARTHSTAHKDERTGKIDDLDRSLTYRVRPEKPTVIALFQTKHLPLPEVERLYPTGSNFRFSDDLIRASLVGRGVSPEFVRAGISLLHRGGKVAVPSKEGWLVLEVTPSGMVEVIDERSAGLR